MNHHQQILFGVLALQSGLISPIQLAEVCSTWRARQGVSLADLLVEQGCITARQRSDLEIKLQQQAEGPVKQNASDCKATATEDNPKKTGDSNGELNETIDMSGTSVHEHLSLGTTIQQRETVERYTLSKLHATGGIGQVWLARDANLERDVALKELRPERSKHTEVWARFVREAQITGQLEHPGIVPVYELGRRTADQVPFYTMRFVRGRTLAEAATEYHRRRKAKEASPMELRTLMNAFVTVCQAVAFAHSRGVIHRDLKPHNIVLGDFGEVMVLDWGLARVLNSPEQETTVFPVLKMEDPESSGGTVQGQVLGTPAYMAPEQAEGRISSIGPATDVYGLGAILYEILTGQPPFMGPQTSTVLRQVVNETPVTPRSLVGRTPPPLEAICMKALSKQPEQRYGTAMELAQEVQRWLADEPVKSYGEPLLQRTWRWVRRHQTMVTTVAALLIMAFIFQVALVIISNQQREASILEQRRTMQALSAESRSNERARQALDEMSSSVIANWLFRSGQKPDAAQQNFLKKTLVWYQEFAADSGNSESARNGVANSLQRIARIQQQLSQTKEAEAAYRQSIDRFDELAAEFPENPKYRQGLAASWNNLGVLYRDTGRYKDSEDAYQKALKLRQTLHAESPKEQDYLLALSTSHTTLGNLLNETGRKPEALKHLQEAVLLNRELVQLEAEKAANRESLITALMNLSVLHGSQKRQEDALKLLDEAKGLEQKLIQEFPQEPRYREVLARIMMNQGNVLNSMGKTKDAEKTFQEVLVIRRKLVDDYPTVPSYRKDLAGTCTNLAILYSDTGRMADAEREFKEVLQINQRLATDFPTVAEYCEDHASSHNNLGVLWFLQGRLDEAETAYRKAHEQKEKLLADYPQVPAYRSGLAASYLNLGILLNKKNKNEDALTSYRQAIEIYQVLSKEFPAVHEYRKNLAKCLVSLGNDARHVSPSIAETSYREAESILQQLVAENPKVNIYRQEYGSVLNSLGVLKKDDRLYEAAKDELNKAVEIRRQLVAGVPNSPLYLTELAQTLNNLATIELAIEKAETSLPLLQEARKHFEASLKANPRHLTTRDSYRLLLVNLALSHALLHKQNEALQYAETVASLAWKPEEDNLSAARAMARCASGILESSSFNPEERKQAEAIYAAKCIQYLQTAIQKGFCDWELLQNNADFKSMRNRDGFNKLVDEAEKNAQKGSKKL